MSPQDLDVMLMMSLATALFVVATNAVITYKLLLWYHSNLLMPALQVVASHQPSLKIVPAEKPPDRAPLRMGTAETKTLDDVKLDDLYTKLHGTL